VGCQCVVDMVSGPAIVSESECRQVRVGRRYGVGTGRPAEEVWQERVLRCAVGVLEALAG
jgi:hypothetical protein